MGTLAIASLDRATISARHAFMPNVPSVGKARVIGNSAIVTTIIGTLLVVGVFAFSMLMMTDCGNLHVDGSLMWLVATITLRRFVAASGCAKL
jgi:hypothetical protein